MEFRISFAVNYFASKSGMKKSVLFCDIGFISNVAVYYLCIESVFYENGIIAGF